MPEFAQSNDYANFVKHNEFIICTDAAFTAKGGSSATFYKDFLIYVEAARGYSVYFANEIDMRVILLAIKKAKDYGFDKVHILPDAWR